MNHYNGIHEIKRPPLTDFAKVLQHGGALPQDPRFQRVKLVPLPISLICGLLNLDGSRAVRFKGLPQGAQVLTAYPQQGIGPDGKVVAMIVLVLYRADYPLLLAGQQPEQLSLMYQNKLVDPPLDWPAWPGEKEGAEEEPADGLHD